MALMLTMTIGSTGGWQVRRGKLRCFTVEDEDASWSGVAH